MNEPRDPHDIERLEQLARFPDENPNPVLRVTPEGTVLYANDAARQTDGLLTGRKHENLAKDLLQDVAMAVSDETVRNVEFQASGKTYNFSLVPVADRQYVNLFGSNITERKCMEQSARENEKLLATILDNSPMLVALRDTEGRFLLVNKRYEEVHDVAKEGVVGKTLHELFSKEEADYYFRGDSEVIATGNVTVNEESIERDGRELVLSVTKFPIVNSSGNVTGVGIIDDDITERKRSEQALAREKQILNMTLESIDQGISMFDADLRLTSFNENFLKILDLPADRIKVGASLEETFRYNAERGDYGPGDVEEQVRERLELARRFEPHQFERSRPDGTVLEIRGKPTADGGFVTTYTDITKRRRAEEKLRKSERRQARILEALSEGIYEWDIEKGTLYLSSTLAELLGLRDDTLGPDDWNALIHPDDFDKYRAALRSNFKGQTERLECEYRARRENGEYRWFSDRGIPIRTEAGRAVKLVGAVRDISDRKLAERRIEETETQMRMALETLPGGLVYTDADLNVVVSNKKFAEMHNVPGELLSPGEPYTGFLRYLAEHGYYGEGDLDAFVAQRVEAIRNPLDTTIDHKTPEGRIHEIRRRKVPGGGTRHGREASRRGNKQTGSHAEGDVDPGYPDPDRDPAVAAGGADRFQTRPRCSQCCSGQDRGDAGQGLDPGHRRCIGGRLDGGQSLDPDHASDAAHGV
jgi:PAS domain S-box-containing protein